MTNSKRQAIADFKQSPSDSSVVSKAFDTEVSAVGGKDSRVLEFVISTGSVDREGDTIDPLGWELDNFMKSGSVLWAHNPGLPPVARPLRVWIENGQLKAQAEFTSKELNPFGYMVFEMYKQGFLKATSVGFRPKEYLFNPERSEFAVDFKRQELLEFSCVPVPANPEAIMVAQKSIDLSPLKWLAEKQFGGEAALDLLLSALNAPEKKSAIPYYKQELAAKDLAWDGAAQIEAATVEDLKVISAWMAENAETKSDYKLPHHLADNKATVWNGVVSAMAALLGARGGVDIPESDKQAVYDHLAKHYEDFDEQPPELKSYSDEELAAIFSEPKKEEQPKAITIEEIRAIVRDEIAATQKSDGPLFEFDAEDDADISDEITREEAQEVISRIINEKLLAQLTGG